MDAIIRPPPEMYKYRIIFGLRRETKAVLLDQKISTAGIIAYFQLFSTIYVPLIDCWFAFAILQFLQKYLSRIELAFHNFVFNCAALVC